jgi:ribose-phosphate pyrophosphokinase
MIKINDAKIETGLFPNKESFIRLIEVSAEVFEAGKIPKFTIDFKFENNEDIWNLFLLSKMIKEKYPTSFMGLIIKYFPYSRMDRAITDYAFSLKYFSELINSLSFDIIVTKDLHSPVTSSLVKNITEVSIQPEIDKVFNFLPQISNIFFPDAGAKKRYTDILELHGKNVFYGSKKRDLTNGNILGYNIEEAPVIVEKDILIIDDLCAKGYTFLKSAEALKELGAKDIYLYVTHCENSIYQGAMLNSGLIKKIFTTDSILTDWSSDIIQEV